MKSAKLIICCWLCQLHDDGSSSPPIYLCISLFFLVECPKGPSDWSLSHNRKPEASALPPASSCSLVCALPTLPGKEKGGQHSAAWKGTEPSSHCIASVAFAEKMWSEWWRPGVVVGRAGSISSPERKLHALWLCLCLVHLMQKILMPL